MRRFSYGIPYDSRPTGGVDINQTYLALLGSHKNEVLMISLEKGDAERNFLTVASDASFCPGGDRSRSGIIIKWCGSTIHWLSKKQSMTTLSTCESELYAAVLGMKIGVAIRDVLGELVDLEIPMKLQCDNLATVRTLLAEVTSWRSRHFAVRAAWARDLIHQEQIAVEHVAGVYISMLIP